MFFSSFCIPALVYLIFMMIHVIVATFEGNYNNAILNLGSIEVPVLVGTCGTKFSTCDRPPILPGCS